MTDVSNSDQHSDHQNSDQHQQTQDDQSSALGRSYGLSGGDSEDSDDSATGSAAGDMSQNQQSQGIPNDDNGMASDAMGSGTGSDMMELDEDEEDELETGSEMEDGNSDTGMTGGR